MKQNALVLIVIFALGFGLALWLSARSGPALVAQQAGMRGKVTPESAEPDRVLPAFSFTTLDGASHNAGDFSGRWLLINFWASWCSPCIAEFPMLLQLAQTYPDRLVLLAVSSDQNVEAIMRFKNRLSAEDAALIAQDNVMIVHDADSAITFDLFQTVRLPETIIVNPQQQMVKKLIGVDWHVEDIKALLGKPQ